MKHFGIICSSAPSHLNLMTTLGNELIDRGHRVTLFGVEDAKNKTISTGLDFCAIGSSEFALGKTQNIIEYRGKLHGIETMKYIFNNWSKPMVELFLRQAPEILFVY